QCHKTCREDVIQGNTPEIAFEHTETVIKVDRTQTGTKNETDKADTQCLQPDRFSNLVAQTSHRLHHSQLAPSICYRYSQRIHHTQYRHQNGHHNLVVGHCEPLIQD